MTSSGTFHSPPPPVTHKPTAFRFKRKHPDDSDLPPLKRRSRSPSSSHRRHYHRHHGQRRHRSRHDHGSPTPSPNDHHLNPETAFRESLFDALADDEGAAYWESVYGQPIHMYSPYRPSSSSCFPSNNNNPEQAELQRMTDDEYATYVRARMWEKSHGHILEERQRREEERIQRKEREEEGRRWERSVEEALRRGEERKRKNRWKDAWGRYLRGWEGLALAKDGGGEEMRERIPWPVETGRYTDVDEEEVERFFRHAPQLEGPGEEGTLGKVLKAERVRWHPDKFVQRAGRHGLDKETIAMVTAVFQIVDRLWSGT